VRSLNVGAGLLRNADKMRAPLLQDFLCSGEISYPRFEIYIGHNRNLPHSQALTEEGKATMEAIFL
jgi:hypothetical protein